MATILRLTFRRLWAQRGLTAATLVGLTVAVTLVMTVPLYADAVNFRILQEELSNQTERNNRPPFAYLYNYIGAWHEPVEWEAVEPVTRYLETGAEQALGLRGEVFVSHFETDIYRLFYDEGAFELMRLATTRDLQEHVTVVDGIWPTQASRQPDDPIQVLMTAARSAEIGASVGDTFELAHPRRWSDTIPVRIVGLWEPLDPSADYWFYAPTSFDEILTVPSGTFEGRLGDEIEQEVHLAAWYWVLDGSRIATSDVDRLVDGALAVEREIDRLLPNARSLQSPVEALQVYQASVSTLTRQLLGFNAPTIGLVVAFIVLVVGLAVQQRRNELAITRSRGGTAGQLITMAAVEGIVLSVLAFGLSLLLAMWLTSQMGRVRSFLDFSAETTLRTIPNRIVLISGLVALVLAILAQTIPTAFAAGDTIITYKLEQARRRRPPWWQRSFLDVLLFAVAAYGMYQLQSDAAVPGQSSGSVLENPILLLLPTIVILSVTLFFLRLLPLLMGVMSRLLVHTDSITLLQATRYLARSTGLYATPLVLLTLTVSLSVFTASLARTFDYQLFDQSFYRVGADINVLSTPDTSAQNRFALRPVEVSGDLYLPPEGYEEIKGVVEATRIGTYPANIALGSERVSVEFVGIEPMTFPSIAYWRDDFSPYRFGTLMNALNRTDTSVIVPSGLLEAQGLRVGDAVPLAISVAGGRVEFSAEIAAHFDYFPTWYPETDDMIVVGNLSTIFERVGGEVPFRVWLDVDDSFDEDTFRFELRTRDAGISIWSEPRSTIEQTLVQPQRQGVFGLLSVGFIASALLTVLGFFLYAIFSFRRRMIELGILRAVGLSTGRMMRFIAWELGLLIVSGLALGTLLGVWISQQFIPFLQTGSRQADFVPPYLVEIAWPAVSQIYLLFGLLFLAAFGMLSLLLQRMRVFEAVKLGETV